LHAQFYVYIVRWLVTSGSILLWWWMHQASTWSI
jgi:hypothetical protein